MNCIEREKQRSSAQGEQDLNSLPLPTDEERQFSGELAGEILQEIKSQGTIPFSRFFELALYHPTHGYYTGPQRVFGREGDFITAPLISPLFSQALGNQVIEVAELLKAQGTQEYTILEIGAGNGTMATDLLQYLKAQNALPHKYAILEISPTLRAQQKEKISTLLPDFIEHVEWLDTPPKKAWSGLILANEVIDALPVERFRIEGGAPYYVDVGLEAEETTKTVRFAPKLRQADSALETFYAELIEKGYLFPEGYESEYCPILRSWLPSLFETMEQGVALFIDYGYDEAEYYRPERSSGTLLAHYKHRAHEDFLIYPGLQDLTANVNFTEVATIAVESGLEFIGYTSQAFFLFGNKIQALVAEAKAEIEDELEWYALSQKVQHLIHPEEMGERFKVIALGKNFEEALQGFELHDYAHQL